jgi:hypothetical protein
MENRRSTGFCMIEMLTSEILKQKYIQYTIAMGKYEINVYVVLMPVRISDSENSLSTGKTSFVHKRER